MGKMQIAISVVDGNVNMQTKYKQVSNVDISQLIMNIEKLKSDLTQMYFKTINKKVEEE
jgi:hypothetical protein